MLIRAACKIEDELKAFNVLALTSAYKGHAFS